jgi:hypothetical protein
MRGTWAGGPAKIATVSAVVGILAFMFEVALFAGRH